jgi:hypothetical protein
VLTQEAELATGLQSQHSKRSNNNEYKSKLKSSLAKGRANLKLYKVSDDEERSTILNSKKVTVLKHRPGNTSIKIAIQDSLIIPDLLRLSVIKNIYLMQTLKDVLIILAMIDY